MNSTAQDEITAYVDGVRAALAGLPEATRDELLEDLPEHLAEVMAEGQGTLTERLGTPEAYAAELRATAGFVGGFPDPPKGKWVTLDEVRAIFGPVLEKADVKIGPLIGYARASEFLVLLRPAWWVLRGYLAAMAIAYLLDDTTPDLGLLPRIGGSDLVALILLAGCMIGSILLGRRSASLAKGPRIAVWAATTFLVVFALAGFSSADSSARDPGYSDAGSYDSNPYSNVNDVFVYDSQGKLVTGARLFDQDGSPIQLGQGWCTDPDSGESWHTRNMGYPYCPEQAPFASPGAAGATARPTASFLMSPSDPPSPSGSVSATPSGPAPSPSRSGR